MGLLNLKNNEERKRGEDREAVTLVLDKLSLSEDNTVVAEERSGIS